jgi:hypothetical protein
MPSSTPNSTLDLTKIGENFVKRALTMEEVKLSSVWEDGPVVLTFFRRFG